MLRLVVVSARSLILLGAVLVALVGTSGAAEASDDLTVLTYNVWGVPNVTPHRAERIEEIGRRLATLDVDVIALQELWLREDAATIAPNLEAAGLTHQHHFMPESEDEKGSGLFIASRHPILDRRFEAFRVGTTPHIPWHVDWMARKGVAVVRIDHPSGPVAIANTHLHASYAVGDYRFVQLSQANQLADVVAPSRGSDPLVVMGDLNVLPADLPARLLTARASLTAASPSFGLDQIYDRDGQSVRLEPVYTKLLFEHPVTFGDGLEEVLSDHPCIVTRYQVRPCEGCAPPAAGSWAGMTTEVASALRSELATMDRTTLLGRLGAPLLLIAAALVAIRRRPRRSLRLALVAALLTFSVWAGYIGWHFGPHRLAQIQAQLARLR